MKTALHETEPVPDRLGHANIQNTMVYMRYTTATRDAQTRQLFASHRVVCIALWGANSPQLLALSVCYASTCSCWWVARSPHTALTGSLDENTVVPTQASHYEVSAVRHPRCHYRKS